MVTQALTENPAAPDSPWWAAVKQRVTPTPQARDMVAFAFRTWMTSLLALFVAYCLQLQSPYWAWLTVWIVAQPTPGMLLSKSLYLVLGTLGGAVLGITLIALFAQTPEIFVLGLATAVAACTVASNSLTNFRAYGTVLAGYTSGLIASGAINAPDQVFFVAMARVSCILTGIACSILVVSLFAPHRSAADATTKLRIALQDAARRAAYSWKGTNLERLKIGRKLITELIALNSLIEFAAAESANFRRQEKRARRILAHIFSLISSRRSLDDHLERSGWPEHAALEIFHEVILDFLNEMPNRLERGEIDGLIDGLHEVHAQLRLLRPDQAGTLSDEVVSERIVIDRLEDLVRHLEGALEEWRNLLAGRVDNDPPVNLNFHRDLRAAWINGLRAFLAVCATGAFWIGSAWDHGPLALVFVSVLMSLFSAHPHPDRVGWTFFRAGLVACFIGMVYKFYFLPMGSGFEWLGLTLGVILVPLGLVMANPATAPAAGAFSFVFVNMVRPFNPMTYDLADTMNNALAIQIGILFGTFSYLLIIPPDPLAARRYVTYRIRRGLGWLAVVEPVPDSPTHWETRMYDRIMRLNDPANPSATPTDAWLDAGLEALTLGNEILRLRSWLEHEKLSPALRASAEKVIAAFGRFLPEPEHAVAEVRRQIAELSRLDPGANQPNRRHWTRLLGAYEEMNGYLSRNPLLTTGDKAIW